MTVNKFTDLTGLKEEHLAVLAKKGYNTPADLKAALDDDEKVKELIMDLNGIGPKTVLKWKQEFAASEPKAEPKQEPMAETETETEADTKAETAVAVADEKKVEVVDEKAKEKVYVPNIKPELDKGTVGELAKRALISGRRPAFKRQEWFRYKKLEDSGWRRPKGIHSKMKRNLKRRPAVVDIGFRGPVSVRNLHPSGFEEILVFNVDDLEGIDAKKQAVRVGGTVGTKKRIAIQERAETLGIRVLNRMV